MIISIEDYMHDADCPELCNNANFTIISGGASDELDAEEYSEYLAYGDNDPWEDYMDLKFL